MCVRLRGHGTFSWPLLALVLTLVLLAGCGAQHRLSVRERNALRIALEKTSGVAPFPGREAKVKCRLVRGGPAHGVQIQGTCKTDVTETKRATRVRLTETWDWRDFSYAGGPKRTQTHTFEYMIAPDGRILLFREYGDFPPQDVR
jgi:hypothetical protein